MRRYVFPVAFGLCVVGLGLALVYDRGLSAFLFALGATCFAVRAWGWWAYGLVFDRPVEPTGWTVEKAFAPIEPLTEQQRGFFQALELRSLTEQRKAEAFRRYREYWAGVGQ